MPSSKMGGRGRESIPHWRVKCGNREVYVSKVGKKDCEEWVRANQKEHDKKLRVIRPNT